MSTFEPTSPPDGDDKQSREGLTGLAALDAMLARLGVDPTAVSESPATSLASPTQHFTPSPQPSSPIPVVPLPGAPSPTSADASPVAPPPWALSPPALDEPRVDFSSDIPSIQTPRSQMTELPQPSAPTYPFSAATERNLPSLSTPVDLPFVHSTPPPPVDVDDPRSVWPFTSGTQSHANEVEPPAAWEPPADSAWSSNPVVPEPTPMPAWPAEEGSEGIPAWEHEAVLPLSGTTDEQRSDPPVGTLDPDLVAAVTSPMDVPVDTQGYDEAPTESEEPDAGIAVAPVAQPRTLAEYFNAGVPTAPSELPPPQSHVLGAPTAPQQPVTGDGSQLLRPATAAASTVDTGALLRPRRKAPVPVQRPAERAEVIPQVVLDVPEPDVAKPAITARVERARPEKRRPQTVERTANTGGTQTRPEDRRPAAARALPTSDRSTAAVPARHGWHWGGVVRLVAAMLIGGLIALVAWLALARYNTTATVPSPTAAASTTPTRTTTAAPTTKKSPQSTAKPSTAKPSTPPATGTPSAKAPTIPAGITACDRTDKIGSRVGVNMPGTTCRFGFATRDAYKAAPSAGSYRVRSATTGRTYTMTCTGKELVICTGGTQARVYLY